METTKVTLAEEVMLLSLDDDSGSAKQRQAAGWAVAGGILLDLVLAERVSVAGKYLSLVDAKTPTGDPLLDGRVELIQTWLRGRDKRQVTQWLSKDHIKSVQATLDRLRDRGIVVEEQRKALGLFPVRRYPEADGTVEAELRARLGAVVLKGAEPDVRTAGLVALLHAAKLHALAFPGVPRKQVSGRMAEIAEGQWASESVRKAIQDMQAAVIAATVAATAAATA
ncbi:GPP34 family phosphoprotein [Streptomyces sp. NPDC001941]|uniref:GOLPH3/VPS74 family protein n=1 Tax=Streptomyces sp. NPDC001941 TaxID=3154659 RepID=UPI00332D663C